MRGWTSTLSMLTLVPLAASFGQRGDAPRITEPIRSRFEISDSSAAAGCLALPDAEPYASPPITRECRVVSLEHLPAVGGRSWAYGTYRHRAVYRFTDSASPAADTIVELEMVLFATEPSRPRSLIAELRARQEEQIVRSITPSVATHAGETVVSVQFCLNGTGGCWQEFLRSGDRRWSLLDDPTPAIRAAVTRRLHGDTSVSTHAPRVDLRTLRGTAAVYSRGDGNCCPSRRAEFELALVGNGFRILRLEVHENR